MFSRVEGHAIVRIDAGDVAEHPGDGTQVARPEAQQVCIASRPVRHVVPQVEQQRALEQEAIGMRRPAKAVEDALQGEAHQHLVEIHALRLGQSEQARSDGRGNVLAHSVASRYGRMTLATRQIFA